MKNNSKNSILALAEGAVMIAVSVGLDLLPIPNMPMGGRISFAMIPLIFFSYRRGVFYGVIACIIDSLLQMAFGWYMPPAGTFIAVIGCILLDYVIAFGVLGIAPLFAKVCGKRRLVGFGVGAFSVCMIRYFCSFLSGIWLWGSYAPDGQAVAVYSLIYNGSYMIPNAIITTVAIVLLCAALDPATLKHTSK